MGYLFAGDAADFEGVVQSSPECLPFPTWCTENSAEISEKAYIEHTSYTGD